MFYPFFYLYVLSFFPFIRFAFFRFSEDFDHYALPLSDPIFSLLQLMTRISLSLSLSLSYSHKHTQSLTHTHTQTISLSHKHTHALIHFFLNRKTLLAFVESLQSGKRPKSHFSLQIRIHGISFSQGRVSLPLAKQITNLNACINTGDHKS